MVAAVDMRGKRGLVFASEQGGSLGCYTAKGLARRIDYIPLALDFGDHVIIINCADVVLTGKKLTQKYYYRHTGYIRCV